MGLSTCWTGWYEQEEMKKVLQLPGNFYVNGIITVGYGEESPKPRPRKNMKEIII